MLLSLTHSSTADSTSGLLQACRTLVLVGNGRGWGFGQIRACNGVGYTECGCLLSVETQSQMFQSYFIEIQTSVRRPVTPSGWSYPCSPWLQNVYRYPTRQLKMVTYARTDRSGMPAGLPSAPTSFVILPKIATEPACQQPNQALCIPMHARESPYQAASCKCCCLLAQLSST